MKKVRSDSQHRNKNYIFPLDNFLDLFKNQIPQCEIWQKIDFLLKTFIVIVIIYVPNNI